MTPHEIASRMMRLFEGFSGAYGTYDHKVEIKNAAKGGKMEIKGTARSIRSPVTSANWSAHLRGEASLGIIPIREDGTCFWGCIDVDRYDVSHAELVKQIKRLKFPLVVCRSKSGGAHLFLFTSEPVAAAAMQAKLRELAASMGLGNCEIFPKQTTLLIEKGDIGNWLNMPYFGGDKTDRFAVKESMAGMSVQEFLAYTEERRLSAVAFEKLTVADLSDDSLLDGPPCLQHLTSIGFPEGTRNNGLFALGVFCKKKFGERWVEVLEEYNRKFMSPPLSTEEVASLIKNLDKKDYNYRCSDQPCVSHCNAILCRTRRFGVGGAEEFPVLSGLSVLDTDPPLWFADIDGQRIELNTDQLQNYRSFHKVAMERLHVCYMMLKQDTWLKMVGSAMRDAIKIESSEEVSRHGHFMELLEDFCIQRHRAESRDEIAHGKPWEDEEKKRYYFRLRDFMVHLEKERYPDLHRNRVAANLQKLGGKDFFNLKGGKGVNVWWVPASFQRPQPADLPAAQRDPI